MLKIDKPIGVSGKELVVSFDLEWTKNYKIKDGNQPFCFSFIFFELPMALDTVEKQLDFGFHLRYCESKEDISVLVQEANRILGEFFQTNTRLTIVGHQLSSDISVILNCSKDRDSDNFAKLKYFWQNRKRESEVLQHMQVLDSRYDLDILLKNKSRRLVDVCEECHLKVVQPELIFSMTRMQNSFYAIGDLMIMEKLSVLNIRHSLSVAILFLMFQEKMMPKKTINTNRILLRNLSQYFAYVRGKEFNQLV